MNNRSPFARTLLTINNAFTLFIASWHMGLMVSVLIFWYPSWNGLIPSTIQDNFSIPAKMATKTFVILVPLAMLTSTIMIISEWKTKRRWPAIGALIGLMGSTLTAKYFLFPINDVIYAGTLSAEQLKTTLVRWMALNNWRVFFSCFGWLSMAIFYSMKTDRPTA